MNVSFQFFSVIMNYGAKQVCELLDLHLLWLNRADNVYRMIIMTLNNSTYASFCNLCEFECLILERKRKLKKVEKLKSLKSKADRFLREYGYMVNFSFYIRLPKTHDIWKGLFEQGPSKAVNCAPYMRSLTDILMS